MASIIQYIVPTATLVLVATWRSVAKKPPLVVGGLQVVRFPLSMRLVFALVAAGIGALFIYTGLKDHPPATFWVIAATTAVLLLLPGRWLFRSKIAFDYNRLLLSSTWSGPREFAFSDVRTETGLGINGYRFEIGANDHLHVSPFARGHLQLLNRLRESLRHSRN